MCKKINLHFENKIMFDYKLKSNIKALHIK